jgi:hypothetical protein
MRKRRNHTNPPPFRGVDHVGEWAVPDTPVSTRRMQASADAQAPVVSTGPRPAPGARRDSRPVEDVPVKLIGSTDDKGPLNKRGKFDEHKFSGSHHRQDERAVHLAMDKAGAPCACDDKTACLAHAAISGRRRHVRPD